MNLIYDSFVRKIEILSKALEKATERTRTMLYVVTFFSLVILVTTFNAYLAWDRKLNAQERLLLSDEFKLIPPSSLKPFNHQFARKIRQSCISKYKYYSDSYFDNNIVDIIHDIQEHYPNDTSYINALDEYIDSLRNEHLLLSESDYFKWFFDRQKFTIPILGLACYADDVYLIGGLGLLILLTYCFFNVRREFRIVQRFYVTIRYIDKRGAKEFLHNGSYNEEETKLIRHNLLEIAFYGCVEFFIFNTGLTRDDYILTLKNENDSTETEKKKTNKPGRIVLLIMYYLPIVAMCFALFFEIKSLFDRHTYLNSYDFFELSIRYFLTGIFLLINVWQCLIINKLNKDNSSLIDKMYQIIIKSRDDLKLIEFDKPEEQTILIPQTINH